MQTALHIYTLVRELNHEIIGSTIIGTEFYKKEREAYILFKTGVEILALGLIYHPVGFGAYLVPQSRIEIKTDEKPWPFFQPAKGSTVASIRQMGLDRIVRIELVNGATHLAIILEALGPNGNFWLLDNDDKILATLRHRKFEVSEYSPPPPPDKLNPFDLKPEDLQKVLKKEGSPLLSHILRKNVVGLDEYLAMEILQRADVQPDAIGENIDNSAMTKIVPTIRNVAAHFNDYNQGYLYAATGVNEVYPFKLGTLKGESGKYNSLSLAIYEAIKSKRKTGIKVSAKQRILEAMDKGVNRLAKKVAKIEADLSIAGKAEDYRKSAEILKANLACLKRGMESIELDDIYFDNDRKVRISLNPALSPVENVEKYFLKYHKGKEALLLQKRRLDIAGRELQSAQKVQAELERDFDNAVEKYRTEMAPLLPKDIKIKTTVPRLPYKPYTLSTGITIFVGRDGADNDTTTFEYARPYELWFHAAQSPGSHVVMKFPDKSFRPSKQEIAETAAIAAYYSKAKNSKTVPIVYTERKYVRKPRRAKAGLVTIEREKMVMVAPKKMEGV
ncbi:MAG: NFACT RNA binding domain-containing protein [candidate division Zixibacteria bacterium]|nr:NFACT RNA binding domain-containing protein [candidate division Zixibacteria bacterium]